MNKHNERLNLMSDVPIALRLDNEQTKQTDGTMISKWTCKEQEWEGTLH